MGDCSIPGCETAGRITRGWCPTHYTRWRRHGSPFTVRAPMRLGDCRVAGCSDAIVAKRLCGAHYARLRSTGSVQEDIPVRHPIVGGGGKCAVDGCDRDRWGTYCHGHAGRVRRTGSPGSAHIRTRGNTSCTVETCSNKYYASGLCKSCYFKAYVYPRRRASKVVKFDAGQMAAKADYYGGKCWICRERPLEHWDHVKPIARGGAHVLSNLKPACSSCNTRKGATWPFDVDEFRSRYLGVSNG